MSLDTPPTPMPAVPPAPAPAAAPPASAPPRRLAPTRPAPARPAPVLPPLPPGLTGAPAPAPRRGQDWRGTPEAVGQWLRRRAVTAGRWAQRHRVSLLVGGALLVLVAVVHGIGMTGNPAPVDDEGTYVAQAWAVQVRHALTPYTYWYDHPPLGWIQLAGWTWLTHGFRAGQLAVAAGRGFMLVAAVVSGGLIFLVARRLGLSRPWAALALLAWALSPLAIPYERQVYLDNIAVPWLLGAFALALTPRRRLWAYGGAGACLAVSVLSKETFLVFAPALVYLVWTSSHRKTRAFCLTALAATFALLVVGYPLYALLKGELLPGPGHVSLYDAVRFQLTGRQGSGSLFSSSSAAHGLVSQWLAADPWLLGAGFILLPVVLCVRRLRPLAVALVVPALVILRGGYLPEPYVIGLFPFCALSIAGAGNAVWGRWSPQTALHRGQAALRWARRAAVGAAGVVVLAAAGPAWAQGIHTSMTAREWTPMRQAEGWVEANVSRHDRLLVDDTMWVDLVEHGFDQKLGVVWFYKLGFANNLDPSVTRRLPGGWRDFNFIVSTPSMRGALATTGGQLPQIQAAIGHSRVVATFGTGTNRVEVRRITVPRA